ncbi:MAG: hypothetical protein ACOC1K_03455 [Nanoarchaeota archaeon]
MKAKRVTESLYEFERGIDPKRALGISRRAKIEEWFENAGVDESNYEIRDDFTIEILERTIMKDMGIKKLFPNIKGNSTLSLQNNNISEIPDGINLAALDLSNNNVSKLLNNIKISRLLDLSNNELIHIEDFFNINGSLDISSNPIDYLPKQLYIGNNLYTTHTNIKEIPADTYIGGNLITDIDVTIHPNAVIVGEIYKPKS